MRQLRPALVASAVLLAVSLSRAGAQSEAAARTKYDASVREFVDAMKRADMPRALNTYAPDATFVEEDGSMSHGRPELQQVLRGVFAVYDIKEYTLETASFHAEGNVAYAGGIEHIRLVDKKTNKATSTDYRFLVVFRADANGRWLLQYGMETALPAKTKAP